MKDKLEKIKKEYEEITKELSEFGVVSDIKKFKNLNKRQSKLKEIVDEYEQLLTVEKTIKENNEIIKKESDKELISMATEENEKLAEKKRKLESKIQLLIIPKDKRDEKDILMEMIL